MTPATRTVRYDSYGIRALLNRAALLLEHPDMPPCVGLTATIGQLRKAIADIADGNLIISTPTPRP